MNLSKVLRFHKFEVVHNFGFQCSQLDPSLFTKEGPNGMVIMMVYVDDIILTRQDTQGILETKVYLQEQFVTKDLGPLRYFLGIEVARN